jgi:predicted transcriptional regulator
MINRRKHELLAGGEAKQLCLASLPNPRRRAYHRQRLERPMTIMTIRIPDDVKEAFDKAFEGEDKDAIIAELIRKALQNKAETPQAGGKRDLVAEFRKFRESGPSMTNEEIRQTREELRREAGY